ncbi:MAG TPA: hypothetical protein PK771_13905 [Spirochaetota bacterium]|nr:hypothetical protein [Spirochaetota bacterium]
MNDKDRVVYDNYLENLSYQKSVFDTARFEGKIEGEIKGKIEGEKIGIEKGEKNKAYESANKMKQKGFDVKLISEITGLTENEIGKL